MTADSDTRNVPIDSDIANVRYCAACGEIFADDAETCPTCGVQWRPPELRLSLYNLAALLTDFERMRAVGSLDDASFAALRRRFEAPLLRIRPSRDKLRPAAVRIPERPAAPQVAPSPPAAPREPLLPKVTEWSAARQADILLYLGAFLLSIAALIFVGYQGNALSGPARFAILLAYTLGFLALGLRLPHWERVREAGTVFLALGALLVPINFIALRTQVVGHDAPLSWIWLVGATTTAALYLALGLRGFGRLYLYPGLAAALIAWGSLAAVVALPVEWFGAWFVVAALLAGLAVPRLPEPQRGRARLATEVLGSAALIASQVTAAIGGRSRAQLPVSYLLVAAVFAMSLLARRRSTRALALLPVLAALALLTSWWASFGLSIAWYGCFLAAAALGYVVNARFDLEERTDVWLATAAAFAGAALVAAHVAVAGPGAHRTALPLTYAEVLVLAGLVYLKWRRRLALAAVPLLAAALAITTGWALDAMGREWIGAWLAGAALGYLAIAEFDAEVRQLWRGAAAVVAAVALLSATIAAEARNVATAELPLTAAILLVGAVWDARRRRDEGQAIVPALSAYLGIATAWTIVGNGAFPWIGCWAAGAALGYLALAETDPRRRDFWRLWAAGAAAFALFAAHMAATSRANTPWQLPVAYGVVLAGALWDGYRRRDVALATLPVLAALLVDTLLWAGGVGAEWWGYAGLAACAAIVATAPWWRRTPLREVGWPYALAGALCLPVLFRVPYAAHPVHGIVAFTLASLIIVGIALRANGDLAALFEFARDRQARILERQLLVLVAGVYAMAAAAYFNAWAGLRAADQAWVFAGLGLTAWAALALAAGALPELQIGLIPIATAALALSAILANAELGRATLLLVLGAIGPVLAVPATRRWSLWAIAAAFGLFALGTGWNWQAWSRANLPLAYAFVAADLWLALFGLRTYRRDERGFVVTALSWLPGAVAVTVAVATVGQRGQEIAADRSIVTTREWAVLAITVAAAAGMVVAEGARLRRRLVWVPGSAGLLLAALLAIATLQPTNVQAFTLTAGGYLVALAFTYRSSGELLGRHLQQHEAVLVAGLLVLTLPAAQQGWQPSGSRYGLELIGMGFVFLALGLTLGARWAVAGGVLTLSGVALRWLAVYSTRVPGWLVFGIAGTLLIGVGLLLLFQRERWELLRHRIARWWLEAPGEHGPRPPSGTGLPPHPTPHAG